MFKIVTIFFTFLSIQNPKSKIQNRYHFPLSSGIRFSKNASWPSPKSSLRKAASVMDSASAMRPSSSELECNRRFMTRLVGNERMSNPEQKALSPEPRMTRARTLSSAARSFRAFKRMVTSSSDSEFLFSGRFNIRVTTLFFLLINSGCSGTSTSLYKIRKQKSEAFDCGFWIAECGLIIPDTLCLAPLAVSRAPFPYTLYLPPAIPLQHSEPGTFTNPAYYKTPKR